MTPWTASVIQAVPVKFALELEVEGE